MLAGSQTAAVSFPVVDVLWHVQVAMHDSAVGLYDILSCLEIQMLGCWLEAAVPFRELIPQALDHVILLCFAVNLVL